VRIRRWRVFVRARSTGPPSAGRRSTSRSLAKNLARHGWQIWLIGSSKDRPIGSQIEQLSGGSCRNLCGATGLGEAVDLLSAAHLVVSNDSGLMHVAAALDRPLIALYGSSSPSFTPPLSPRAEVMRLELPCSPCFARDCPLGHFRCMRELDPGQVLQRATACTTAPVGA
jgi:heptosyltransferase-2